MLVVLSSITTAERIKKVLATENIKSEIVQTPKIISEGGCGYSLRLSPIYEENVILAAKQLKVSIRGIYDEEGTKNNMTYNKR
ncbi:MAG: DUF3343 domain-containing protein [Bacillota bacterium]|nr:DUF3343 domain-containing protein [Bacillota bacterium]